MSDEPKRRLVILGVIAVVVVAIAVVAIFVRAARSTTRRDRSQRRGLARLRAEAARLAGRGCSPQRCRCRWGGLPVAGATIIAEPEAEAVTSDSPAPVTTFEDRPEGIARDRWDVAIETTSTAILIECGAIRERVSQELARAVFDAVKRDIERRDRP